MATTLCPCGRWHRLAVCPACGREAPPSRSPLWIGLGVLAVLVVVLPVIAGLGVFAWMQSRPSIPPVAANPRPTSPVKSEPASKKPPAPEPTPPSRTERKPADLPAPETPPPEQSPHSQPSAATGRLESEPVAKHRFRVGESFDQEVVISRRSAFRILGTELATAADYAFVSRFTIASVNPDGNLTAKQEVKETRLIDCDPTSRETLIEALQKANGAVFSLSVAPDGVVKALKGPKDPIRILGGALADGAQSFRVWSLLDEDGWKELAGLTFFRCDQPPQPGRTWTRGLEHNWGPLGSWTGRTQFLVKGPQTGGERIDYVHSLSYRPPGPGLGQGLPFTIGKAEFRTPAAGGALLYDSKRERVTAADEAFRVQGALAVSLAGSDAVVELEETQVFRLTIRQPSEPELSGRKPLNR